MVRPERLNPMIHENIFEVKLDTLLTGLLNANLAANVSSLFKKHLQRYLSPSATCKSFKMAFQTCQL